MAYVGKARERVVCPKCNGWYRIKSGDRHSSASYKCDDCGYTGRVNRNYYVPDGFVFPSYAAKDVDQSYREGWKKVVTRFQTVTSMKSAQALNKEQTIAAAKRSITRQMYGGIDRHALANIDRIKGAPLTGRDPTYSNKVTPEAIAARSRRHKIEDMKEAARLGVSYEEYIGGNND